jgi:predicted amidophosphoribosyltransferase
MVAAATLPFVVLFLLAFADLRKQQTRADEGRCANCGYDLRATPNRCPECGTIPAAATSRRHPEA